MRKQISNGILSACALLCGNNIHAQIDLWQKIGETDTSIVYSGPVRTFKSTGGRELKIALSRFDLKRPIKTADESMPITFLVESSVFDCTSRERSQAWIEAFSGQPGSGISLSKINNENPRWLPIKPNTHAHTQLIAACGE